MRLLQSAYQTLQPRSSQQPAYRTVWERIHVDITLLLFLLFLISLGLLILYSSASLSPTIMAKQLIRLGIAFVIMFGLAQISPIRYQKISPLLYFIGVFLLLGVMFAGDASKGAQRWMEIGGFRFQPSEILKLAVPMMLAWFLHEKKLPPSFWVVFASLVLIALPGYLIMKQPDLGTAIMVILSGGCLLLFAGLSWRYLVFSAVAIGGSAPVLWHYLHDYQRERILTFLNPERDPLGSGYHIIQSKIAIGSGGLFGKGWMQGTQSHLQYLPEHTTDFIFAVCGEEFGLVGCALVMGAYLLVVIRALFIASQAQDTYGRLLAGTLGLSFFLSAFVNIGMVIGLLPVVGLPLPLISYGGTSMVTIMAGFGILMSIQTHKKLYSR